jgi:hypothetical protein
VRFAFLIALAVSLAACAAPKTAPAKPSVITIGTPSPDTRKITIAPPVENSSCSWGTYQDCPDAYADPSQWPQACDLMSKAQLHELLPQATDVTMQRGDVTIDGAEDEYSEDTVTGATCDISFTLPATGDPFEDKGWSMSLSVKAAGGPDAVRLNYQSYLQAVQETVGDNGSNDVVIERHGLGPTDCFETVAGPNTTTPDLDVLTLECYRGSLEFTVSEPVPPDWPAGGITFEYRGKTSTFRDVPSGYQFLSGAAAEPLVSCVNALIP